MKKLLFFTTYNFIFLPLIYLFSHIGIVFSPKLRHGIIKRHLQWRTISPPDGRRVILFHTASMGEYEHIRPLFTRIKQLLGDSVYLVNMFFSPSGYRHVSAGKEVDSVIYSPLDTPWAVWRLYRKLSPSLLVIAKHDVWPNQVMLAKAMDIPVILVNASMSSDSSRLKWWTRGIHRFFYGHIQKIYTISQTDRNNFLKLVSDERLHLAGDTKFDQVIIRKERNRDKKFLPDKFWRDRRILVMGSIWPSDFKILGPVIRELLPSYPDLNLLFVPHEPSEKHILEIAGLFPDYRLYSGRNNYNGERAFVVDTIGVLADLYKYAHIAFVGGGNKEGVHNVMEAAVYGVPVLYGPNLGGSNEAREMAEREEGGHIIRNRETLRTVLTGFLNDPEKQKTAGSAALNFVMQRLGASDQVADEITKIINPNPVSD